MIKSVVYIFFTLFLSLFLYGNIYFWVDENGIKHFTNITPALNETVEEFKESNIVFPNQQFKVLKVFDGDTIKVTRVDLIFKIRLVGIDSPELGFKGQKTQPFSQKAKQHLTGLLKNKKVRIKSYGTDAYNRQLAEVFSGNKNINIEMIRAGLAEVYKGRRPKKLDSQIYLKEEARARKTGKGMWIQGRLYKSPRQWRKEHPRK
ncbi:MAG: thermonuclease family protein [Desulfobacterales bacterium]|nr:thermonuclease family protein [Desulfobacterales bacterium]MBU8910608.1 thermonuclease family protein [Desulfobacterales bacterium]